MGILVASFGLLSPALLALAFFAMSSTAEAQFKEVGPPPFSPAVAHQRIRDLLEKVDDGNRQQTIATISGWLVWYRDIFDEELIAAWRNDQPGNGQRANLPPVVNQFADPKIAAGIVEFSWRQQRAATFNPMFAAMFTDLMSRYSDSARPFLDDLLGRGGQAPQLSESEAETVCRILIDLPDTDAWKTNVRQILPLYPRAAERVLDQEARSSDQERAYRAQAWLGEIRPDNAARQPQVSRRSGPMRTSGAYQPPVGDETTSLSPGRRPLTDGSQQSGGEPEPGGRSLPPAAPIQSAAIAPTSRTLPPSATPEPRTSTPSAVHSSTPGPVSYNGPRSGALECKRGVVIPQNGEYVFRDLPPGRLQLDYDTKIWDARVAPGEGTAQRVILTNKRPGEQKRCVVRWSMAP
ncbi:MAG TPA: hypothetical protein VHZ74_23080 [Bryobacteraceae bacterium]|nr:hypothetical protein [Bryobacteraceae bacterium]